MLKQKNSLCLDYLCEKHESGCWIFKIIDNSDEVIPIAYILWNENVSDCYIQTIKDNFQTYIVTYENFADFIYLIDEAYDLIREQHNYKITF